MHILFLTDNFPPEVNAPASRTFEHAKEWVRLGNKVTVITCAPNFPNGEVFDGYKNKAWQSEDIEGIRVIRVWSYITSNEGFSKRILDYLSYMIASFIASFFVRKVDAVVGTSPQFFTAVSAWAVAGIKRRPFIFELRDIWPESIRAVGAMKQSRVLDWFEKLELFLYRRADKIISVTNSFKLNLEHRGIQPSKIAVVTNGVDAKQFKPMTKDAALVSKLNLGGKFVVGYIGTHGMAHALETPLNAALTLQAQSAAQNIHFLFLGGGAEKKSLQAKADELELSNVTFLDSVPKEEVSRYWSLLDVSIVHLRKSELFKTVIPSKIFECMGMGIPIAHGVEGESAVIVSENKVGTLFEPENHAELTQKLLSLKADRSVLKEMSKNGPIAAKNFDRSALALKMLSEIRLLVK